MKFRELQKQIILYANFASMFLKLQNSNSCILCVQEVLSQKSGFDTLRFRDFGQAFLGTGHSFYM